MTLFVRLMFKQRTSINCDNNKKKNTAIQIP